MKRLFLIPPVVFLIMLIDGQLTKLVTNILPYDIEIVSCLLLITLIVLSKELSPIFSMCLFLGIGFLYDIYYFGVIGIATVVFLVFSIIVTYSFQYLRLNIFSFLLLEIILIFLFEVTSYFLTNFFGLNHLEFNMFIVKNLAPTMIFNLILGIIVYPFVAQFSKNNRHRIVINA